MNSQIKKQTVFWGTLALCLSFAHCSGDLAGPTDRDHDGLTDQEESTLGTDPSKADTDGDGMTDYEEVSSGLDPLVEDLACTSVPGQVCRNAHCGGGNYFECEEGEGVCEGGKFCCAGTCNEKEDPEQPEQNACMLKEGQVCRGAPCEGGNYFECESGEGVCEGGKFCCAGTCNEKEDPEQPEQTACESFEGQGCRTTYCETYFSCAKGEGTCEGGKFCCEGACTEEDD